MNEKNVKITKRSHVYKGYVSTYSVKILNFFNPELQLKDSESAIKNKLIDLMSQLKVFKFVTALVIEFKKYKVMIKHYMQPFTRTQKQRQLLMKKILIMHLNQSIALLYQTLKNTHTLTQSSD